MLGIKFGGRNAQFLSGALNHGTTQKNIALRFGIIAQNGLHITLLEVGGQADRPDQLNFCGGLIFGLLAGHHDQHNDHRRHEAQQQQPQPLGNHVEILADIQSFGCRPNRFTADRRTH